MAPPETMSFWMLNRIVAPAFRVGAQRMAQAGAVLTCVLALGGCGTFSRPADRIVAVAPEAIRPVKDPRLIASDRLAVSALRRQLVGGDAKPASVLALSGGGANGAYGAGVLVGWTESGRRPSFNVVTGVSTGALAAPFAFLGPRWDRQLQAAYSDGQAKDILAWRQLATFILPSLYSSEALRKLVDRAVTPAMLGEIASEHAKGRRLLVATTNLDTQQSVIWDMGVIATQGGPQGLALFKDVLVASASIPGVFPPVMIGGRQKDGRIVEDMHVDGGVNTPFLAVPEGLMLWERTDAAPKGGQIFVLINGHVGRQTVTTKGRLKNILERTYASSGNASTRSLLMANAAFAQRNRLSLEVTAVPDEVKTDTLDFSRTAMLRLFELGRARARDGQAWKPWGDYLETSAHDDQIVVVRAPPAGD